MSQYNSPQLGRSYQPYYGSDPQTNDRVSTPKRRCTDSDRSSDCGSDVEFAKKDEQMLRYKEKLQRFKIVADTQAAKITEQDAKIISHELKIKELEDQIKEMETAKEEYDKKSKGIDIYTHLMDAKVEAKEAEKIVAIKTAEDQFKCQLEDKQKEINGMKTFVDKNKALDSTVQQLKKENSALNKNNMEKDIQLQGMEESLQTIEQLKDENVVKSLRANKYQLKYETLKSDTDSDYKKLSEKLKSENTKYKNEITSLKRQKKYFQNNNENNKRISVAISHTQIIQMQIYGYACRQFGQNSLYSIEDIYKQVVKLIAQAKKEKTSETLQNLANIVTDLKDKNNTIEEEEKIILEERDDDKVLCGECGHLFDNTGDLSHHMTVKHKICTTDRFRSRDDIQIVTIDDD